LDGEAKGAESDDVTLEDGLAGRGGAGELEELDSLAVGVEGGSGENREGGMLAEEEEEREGEVEVEETETEEEDDEEEEEEAADIDEDPNEE
jgi:hypothetical protein